MAARAAILGYVLMFAAACTDRPLTTGSDGSTGSATSTGEPTTGTGEPTPTSTDTSATSGTTDVTTSEPATTTGSPVVTTDEPGTTTGGPIETTGTSTGDTGSDFPAPACPSLCERTTVHEGDLSIKPGDSTVDLVCVTRVVGTLRVSGALDEAALAGLSGLEQVDGLLRIEGSELLTGLAPFACLREADELQLIDLPNLVDVSALSGLTSVGKFGMYRTGASTVPALSGEQLGLHTLELIGDPALEDLAALATWTASEDGLTVTLDDLPALTSIAGLADLLADSAGTTQSVAIAGTPKLASLTGLEPLVTPQWIFLDDLPLISDLGPLAQLELIGTLSLNGMPLVKSFEGLGKLKQTGWLILGGCINGGPDAGGMAGLTSLAGLDSLAQLGTLGVANSSKLSSLTGAPALAGKLEELHLVNNPQLDQADVDAFITQLGQQPETSCLGDWNTCGCIFLMPP